MSSAGIQAAAAEGCSSYALCMSVLQVHVHSGVIQARPSQTSLEHTELLPSTPARMYPDYHAFE